MADQNSERPGGLVETHKGYNPRIFFFYFLIAAILLTLGGGLAYRQLFSNDRYHEAEKKQNQRRILVPGPRGNIFDRNGRVLVANRPRFAVTLYLDQLRQDFRAEYIKIRKAYRDADDVFFAGGAGADVEDHGVGGEEEQGVGAEGDGSTGVEEKAADEGRGRARPEIEPERGEGDEETAAPDVKLPRPEVVVELVEKRDEEQRREGEQEDAELHVSWRRASLGGRARSLR